MLFLTIPLGMFVIYQYWTSNLSLFKTVGTEPKYVNMCRTKFLAQSLISLDLEITFIALLLVASAALTSKDMDLFAIIVLPVGFVFMLIWACIGYFAVMKLWWKLMRFNGFYLIGHWYWFR